MRRRRSIWRRPGNQRCDRKVLTDMNGDPWNLTPQPRESSTGARSVHLSGTSNQVWWHERLFGMFRGGEGAFDGMSLQLLAQVNKNVETPPSSSSGPAPGVGRLAPEDATMEAAESSAAQSTSSVVRTLETQDDASAKRQRLMAGMPILHETDVDVNVDAHKMVVLAAMPDDQEQWAQWVIDWEKKHYGAKSRKVLDTQKVYEGRLRELANIENLEVAEPIKLQEARAQNLEIVYGKCLDDVKGTPAVRSRLVATQVNTYAREDVTQATPPNRASRIIVSQAATKTDAKSHHD